MFSPAPGCDEPTSLSFHLLPSALTIPSSYLVIGASRMIKVINFTLRVRTFISPGTVWYLDQSIRIASLEATLGIDQYCSDIGVHRFELVFLIHM